MQKTFIKKDVFTYALWNKSYATARKRRSIKTLHLRSDRWKCEGWGLCCGINAPIGQYRQFAITGITPRTCQNRTHMRVRLYHPATVNRTHEDRNASRIILESRKRVLSRTTVSPWKCHFQILKMSRQEDSPWNSNEKLTQSRSISPNESVCLNNFGQPDCNINVSLYSTIQFLNWPPIMYYSWFYFCTGARFGSLLLQLQQVEVGLERIRVWCSKLTDFVLFFFFYSFNFLP